MRNTLLILFIITILTTQLPTSKAYSVGVKQGDWIRYDETFYQKTVSYKDYQGNSTQLITYESLIQILQTIGTMIKFNQTYINHDGSTRYRTTYLADPTQPYYGHPEIAVHHYIIPSNLSAGSNLPEPIQYWTSVGNITYPAWSQIINETRMTNILGTFRETNYVHWTVSLNNEVGVMRMERECLFDRRTGIVLSLYNNSTTSYVDDWGFLNSYTEVHQYRVKETNMWELSVVESWELGVVVTVCVVSISIIILNGLKPRKLQTQRVRYSLSV